MEAGPSPLVESLVGWLLPPACREHVLGDLHERYASPRQYVLDAAATVPLVIWGQVRRTSTMALALAEYSVVYLSFASAVGTLDQDALKDGWSPLAPAIPALAALVALVLRDAWAGPRPRLIAHVALDAVLGAAATIVPQTVLISLQSPLALGSDVLFLGSAMSLVMLSGARVALSPTLHRGGVGKAAEGPTNPKPSPPRRVGMQQDLRYWWWTIAGLGLAGWVVLFLHPLTNQFRPVLLGWLIAFAVIGAYQRRQTLWPTPPAGQATTRDRQAYRAELERRRDAQSRWPARRGPIAGGLIALALLSVAVRPVLLAPHAGPMLWSGAFAWLAGGFVLCVLGLYLFTRTLTNRAAHAFQREIDALDSLEEDSGRASR